MIPSTEVLIAFARLVQDEPLQTLRRKSSFRVAVIGNNLEFTPNASPIPRQENNKRIATILTQLAKTNSFQKSDYAEISFNASYVLALVKLWQKSKA
jgi:hypothetical protein